MSETTTAGRAEEVQGVSQSNDLHPTMRLTLKHFNANMNDGYSF
jgi:hypothetical protein